MRLLQILPFVSLGLARAVPGQDNNVCVVKANGHRRDDVPNILRAFRECDNGGTVVFPEDQSYWIATRLNPVINNVAIEWRGKWTVSAQANVFVDTSNILT